MDGSRTTGWTVAAIGAAVAALGWLILPTSVAWGAGIIGFGAAHIVLGLLDTQRPTIKK